MLLYILVKPSCCVCPGATVHLLSTLSERPKEADDRATQMLLRLPDLSPCYIPQYKW